MRISAPSVFTGTLGELLQTAWNALNFLSVDSQSALDSMVRGGKAFIGTNTQAAVAAQNSHCQVFASGGAGTSFALDAITIAKATAGFVSLTRDTTAKTNDDGVLANRKFGMSNAVEHMRSQGNAGVLGTVCGRIVLAANQPLRVEFRYPLIFTNGQGFNVVNETLNEALTVWWEIREP